METINGWRDTDRMILLSCTTCAVSLMSRIFTLSITFTATGTYRAGADFGSEPTEPVGNAAPSLVHAAREADAELLGEHVRVQRGGRARLSV
jgi:hypothetical protein